MVCNVSEFRNLCGLFALKKTLLLKADIKKNKTKN